MLIVKLQHKNLVRLLGCCIEGDEKILVYEYMPKKSLDFFLFDPIKHGILNWELRVDIIEGIAQGLLYLHQYLSNKLNSATCHLSILGKASSIKSDVFSFGVLLLEISSGKKNTGFYHIESLNLLGYSWDLWKSGMGQDLKDPILGDVSSTHAVEHTILHGQWITASNTIVSAGNVFKLGFFSPGNGSSTMNYYLGIWYKNISEQTVVWVANRDYPFTDSSAALLISADGNLVIVKGKISYTLTNISSNGNTSATLLDSGNLVLRDETSGDLLWESFDYPSHTLLPGMKLGRFDTWISWKPWSLISWKSREDPSPGVFSLESDPLGMHQFFIRKGYQKYWTSGVWNGKSFPMIPDMTAHNINITFSFNRSGGYFTYSVTDASVTIIFVLDVSGELQLLSWSETNHQWDLFWFQPSQQCEVYAYCGTFSSCSQKARPFCQCLPGFEPFSIKNWNAGDMSEGCVRKAPLQCSNKSEANGKKDQFLWISKVRLPVNPVILQHRGASDCKSACLSNCSCSAYAYGSDGCSIWSEDLFNVEQLTNDDPDGRDFYLKLADSEFLSRDSRRKWWKWLILALAVSMTLSALVYCMWRRTLRKRAGEDLMLFDIGTSIGTSKSLIGGKKEVDLPLFSFASVSLATDNFSDTNKLGEGGFGPVYKNHKQAKKVLYQGKLLKEYEVAVKRLSRKSGQGLEELQNEAMLIVKLQHKNLVRLLGCCIERDEKILIYEYMPNKSLDFLLFDPIKHGTLNWELRVNIIEGIAQGLLYLHQYSRLQIIHRDLKASNILLDKDMNPKISDFGMARIFGGNGSQATNRIVGTYGYMSPEYALYGLFSIKSDVFSFGVLLLEILSGKKNTGFYLTDFVNLLGYAWDSWKSGMGQNLKDPILGDIPSTHMLLRYINIGLLCVQESAADRPTMSSVVSMLSNELVLLPSPKQPAFSTIKSVPDRNLCKSPERCSLNSVTVSILEPRRNVFELGFFSPWNGSSTMNYYVGIWYKRISVQTVVWVANRDYLLTDPSAVLSISADGNLAIVKGKFLYMLTNISSNGNTSAALLDSGNLVLRDRTSV
ncbi:unnamed protein product [Camellia sinensis]